MEDLTLLVNISLEEAQQQILSQTRLLSEEKISLIEAIGRVSSMELLADANLPPYAQSAVDGYALAVNAVDGKDTFFLNGQLKLNDNPLIPLQTGQAMGVLTGGNLPSGTRAVVPHERAAIEGSYLKALEEIKTGNNIKKAGEDFAQGDQLVPQASILTPAHISLLAAYGKEKIVVYRQPRVAVLSLSKNVIPWDMIPEAGQIRDSNGPLLGALVHNDGGIMIGLETAGDKTSAEIKSWIIHILEQADVLVITGGTYAEADNEARLLMKEIGAEILYWDVAIQPGSHTGASIWNSRLLFALSGNPAACAVGYQLFVAPALRAMQGLIPCPKRLKARCSNGFYKKSGSRRMVRGQASWSESGLQVSVLPGQKPSMIRSLLNCNALIDLAAGSPPVEAGSEVSIFWLDFPY